MSSNNPLNLSVINNVDIFYSLTKLDESEFYDYVISYKFSPECIFSEDSFTEICGWLSYIVEAYKWQLDFKYEECLDYEYMFTSLDITVLSSNITEVIEKINEQWTKRFGLIVATSPKISTYRKLETS